MVRKNWRHTFLATCAAFGGSLALCHCSDDGADSTSQNHTEGTLISANSPYQWADTEYETYRKINAANRFMPIGDAAPSEHLAVRRLQGWVDFYDRLVRKQFKARTGQEPVVPKPIVKVVSDPTGEFRNAFVAPIETCAAGAADLSALRSNPLNSSIPPGASSFRNPPKDSVGFPVPGAFVVMPGQCVNASNWPADGNPLDWYNGLNEACQFEPTSQGVRVVGEKCALMAAVPTAQKTALLGTVPFIHITTSMIDVLSEKAAALILAHELGHYYRSHAAFNPTPYWYEQKTPPVPGKPVKVADSDQLTQRLVENMSERHKAIEGSVLDAKLYFTAAFLPQKFSVEAMETVATCKEAHRTYRGRSLYGISSQFRSAEMEKAYLKYETTLLECMGHLQVTEDGAAGMKTADFRRAIRIAGKLAEGIPTTGSLLGAFTMLNDRALAKTNEVRAFFDSLERRYLGVYTGEQEADDFSMELLALAGMNPNEYIDSWLEFTSTLQGKIPLEFDLPEMSFNECVSLYRQGWKRTKANGETEYVYAPMGNLADQHHGVCYRLFNFSREKDAHRYTPAAESLPTFAESWESVQAASRAFASINTHAQVSVELGAEADAKAEVELTLPQPIVEFY